MLLFVSKAVKLDIALENTRPHSSMVSKFSKVLNQHIIARRAGGRALKKVAQLRRPGNMWPLANHLLHFMANTILDVVVKRAPHKIKG